ncbi:MAG: DNA methyltransferase, partial [Candidatus Bipolaricaulota bacterium]|nr:DNA methyltransferase [Candidatus Bipolaricaulota bacterium]
MGIHSYLTYLRDRLLLARELLTESGSIFVQINDENMHRVRLLLDEIFGADNAVAVISFKKTAGLGTVTLPIVCDYLLWYAKNGQWLKVRPIYEPKEIEEDEAYAFVEFPEGQRRRMSRDERETITRLDKQARVYRQQILLAAGLTSTCVYPIQFCGET